MTKKTLMFTPRQHGKLLLKELMIRTDTQKAVQDIWLSKERKNEMYLMGGHRESVPLMDVIVDVLVFEKTAYILGWDRIDR